jgi:T-complex protein 1 subunit theta
MRKGIPNIFKAGTKHLSGLEEALIKNIKACKMLADLLRTSMGPNGMNKLVINRLNKMFVTSDSATIINELDVEHPAAKLIVMAAQMQEREVGDGSNYVIVFAGELLARAEELIRMGLHPSEILNGYQKAGVKALELLKDLTAFTVEGKQLQDPETIRMGIYAAMSSKQFGSEQLLARLVTEACLAVLPDDPSGFSVDNVRVVKQLGGSLDQSEVIRGMVLTRDTEGTIKKVKDAKVAVFTCSIQASDTETKGTVLLQSADELLKFSSSEEKHLEGLVASIAKAGVNVVVSGGNIDDTALHFLEKHKLMAVKVQSKFDLRRITRVTKARTLVTFGHVQQEHIGRCASVFVREVGGTKLTIFQQDAKDKAGVATILLRASTENLLNGVEKAIDDGVNTVKGMTRDGRFVVGGGAVDLELSRVLERAASEVPGLEQHAMRVFAQALEVVPRTLAENAGLNSLNVLSQLRAIHDAKGEDAKKFPDPKSVGIDMKEGAVADMKKLGVFDLMLTKAQALKLAVDVTLTVLRVDQIIMAKPAGGPKMGQPGQDADDD